MTILVKLFGDLRRKIQDQVTGGAPIIIKIDNSNIKTVKDVLNKLQINEIEVSHIFVNSRYAGFKKWVNNSDTIALFPKNMGLLYKWYFHKDEDE